MKPVIELYNVNAVNLMEMVDRCKHDVYLVTDEGDRLNLKSKLCQFMGIARLIEGGKIAEAFVICDNEEDESKLFRFNLYKDETDV